MSARPYVIGWCSWIRFPHVSANLAIVTGPARVGGITYHHLAAPRSS